ncbi:TonB-dependent receptor [Acanthopleuribacter pedis]|uniref:TonB-dependent receptor n=1 Tax=Acanthopleuribacter pedis TaxID=442870 RepID=A0A8J7QFD5_9BACT|nr:TonB-dependent receptor [Acanthopleuribacter pedis]
MSVITAQEISQMGAKNLEEVLRTVPGFDVVLNPTGSNLMFGVRGVLSLNFSSNSIKYLLNGHTLNSLTGSPLHYFDYLPIEFIKKIEIIRGPGSALYGANAFMGVINIITKTSDDERFVSLRGGSFSSARPGFLYTSNHSLIEWSLAGSFYETDGESEEVREDFASNVFQFGSAAPGNTTLDADSSTFNFEAKYGDFNLNVFATDLNRNYAIGIAAALTDENELKVNSNFAVLGYEKTFLNDKLKLESKVYYDKYNFFHSLEIFSEEFNIQRNLETPFPDGEGIRGIPAVKFELYGTETTFNWNIREGFDLLSGILYDRSRIFDPTHFANTNVNDAPVTVDGVVYQPGQFLPFGHIADLTNVQDGNWINEADRTNGAAFAQATLDVKTLADLNLESLVLTIGIRHDDYDDIGSTTNPRAGLVLAPNESIFMKALYGEAFRAPTFDELHQINNPTNVGNPDLLPEELKTFEFQFGAQFGEKAYATISYFDIEVEQNIQLVGRDYKNVGRVTSSGIELDAKMLFGERRYLYANATYSDVKNHDINALNQEIERGNSPDFMSNIGFNWQFNPLIHFNAHVNYTTERNRNGTRIAIDTGEVIPQDSRPATPDRTLVNFSVGFQINDGFSIQASGHNVFDEDQLDPDNTRTVTFDVPRAGANFSMFANYRF